jgi:two-component system phosphate regulon sensor histidine kinase PhoR
MGAFRIQQRLFAAFLLLLACVTVPAAILLDHWLGSDVQELVRASLTREALAMADGLARATPTDLPAWVAHLGEPVGARITVIGLDGIVVADSEVAAADLQMLENHGHRPEVVAALRDRAPRADLRHSATVGRDMLYVAVPVGDPARLVLRLALPLDQVEHIVGRAHAAVWLAGLLAFVLVLALGAAVARWLSRPIVAMTRAARAMSHGEFTVSLPPAPDDELGELVHALETLRSQLAARIEELRVEGTKLRAVLNGMREGVALVQGGAISIANPAFAHLLGVGSAVEGRSPLEAARLPQLAEIIEMAISERREANKEVQVGARSLLLQAHPLGTPVSRQAVVVLIDMTENRRLERLRREFVANASHELRTPVAAIVGVAETLSAGAAEDPEARASFLDILLRHAERLSQLTADLLDIARLEAGYRPRVESVPVAEAVEAVVSTLRAHADDKGISLKLAIPPGLALAAERQAVEQVLTNLIDNAIKYTPRGGQVSVRAEPGGNSVQLIVEDTGPGIPEEHLPRLFERFYRVDNARSRELGGTGLGLSIVKHLVLAHRGDVRVESQVGKGTRFIVRMPRA